MRAERQNQVEAQELPEAPPAANQPIRSRAAVCLSDTLFYGGWTVVGFSTLACLFFGAGYLAMCNEI